LEANEAATREKDWFGSLYSKSRDAERLLFKEKEAMNLELVDLEQQHQQLLHSEVQSAEELADLREDNESLSVELHANRYIVAANFFTISSLYLASWPISLLHAHTLRFCRSYRLSPYLPGPHSFRAELARLLGRQHDQDEQPSLSNKGVRRARGKGSTDEAEEIAIHVENGDQTKGEGRGSNGEHTRRYEILMAKELEMARERDRQSDRERLGWTLAQMTGELESIKRELEAVCEQMSEVIEENVDLRSEPMSCVPLCLLTSVFVSFGVLAALVLNQNDHVDEYSSLFD
jgi:hypothetical protein